MIPWRLNFSGIRDYTPTTMDLAGVDDHVMITGPNGAGKSTITFCMGAVLYSSKVDVEGLKSRNLLPEQIWKANVSLLFKNDGVMKIDAPTFIEFSLKIIQEHGQPIKKEFFISMGEQIDKWEETIKYTSGDRFYNFSAYKKDLQYKYKIDPDLFYLIWYQQEVNQFAVMHPEERFRIFSEMHGIDQAQRDWEESVEKMKETKETLRIAETNVKLKKQELAMKKNDLDRFLANQKRLHEGATLYIQSLLQLENHYKKEKTSLEELVEQLKIEIDNTKDDFAYKRSQKENYVNDLSSFNDQAKRLEDKLEQDEEKLKELKQLINDLSDRITELEKELADISERKKHVTRTEEEVHDELEKVAEELMQTNRQYETIELQLKQLDRDWEEKVKLIVEIKQTVSNEERLETIHRERLREYQSSHVVNETIESINEKVEKKKNEKLHNERILKELNEELALLEQNRDISARQIESLKFFRARNMKAYPLNELIELDLHAQLKDEERFNAIKYTIFFQGKDVQPPNDLYHVPLMNIVPDRSLLHLPSLHLTVKAGLSEVDLPQAMKALWWVEQFFKDREFGIHNGTLVDPLGLRGAQEKKRFILSQKAKNVRKQEVKALIHQFQSETSQLHEEIQADTKRIQELNGIIQLVRESEAFMTNEHERMLRKKKLAEEIQKQQNIKGEKEYLQQQKETLWQTIYKKETFQNTLQKEATIYKELGRMKDKYEELNEKRKQYAIQQELHQTQKNKLSHLEDDLEKLSKDIQRTKRKIDNLDYAIEEANRELSAKAKQLENTLDKIDVANNELVRVIHEITELKSIIPDIYKEVAAIRFTGEHTIQQLKQNRENGQIMFSSARNEQNIDPAAPENYQIVLKEHDRLDDEYKRTNILLEQNIERTEQLKNQLETTINMRVLEIRQRFLSYMAHFQFEGEISWESHEDRKGRTHFKLFIKARKEGHRGTMEDVSTKARGGRVGKGVSGGEESLSSLLFALALLQNLQTTPGFIVLDEFDSALDEHRKLKVFNLYEQQLKRKLIILTPKSHEETYLNRFQKAFVVKHDPTAPKSKVVGIVKV